MPLTTRVGWKISKPHNMNHEQIDDKLFYLISNFTFFISFHKLNQKNFFSQHKKYYINFSPGHFELNY